MSPLTRVEPWPTIRELQNIGLAQDAQCAWYTEVLIQPSGLRTLSNHVTTLGSLCHPSSVGPLVCCVGVMRLEVTARMTWSVTLGPVAKLTPQLRHDSQMRR